MPNNDQLAADVAELSRKLARPVSSKDLLRHYKEFPDGRPLLLQRLGQLLIKLARPRVKSPGRIHQIGIIGNLSFYAPELTPEITRAFTLYGAQVALAEQCRIRLPEHAMKLIGTRFESMARNALAGYLEEWSPFVELVKDGSPALVHEMQELLNLAREHAAPEFIKVAPSNLISRAEAAALLRKEYTRRIPGSGTVTMNVNRHLVQLTWPQSRLFPPVRNLFWEDQVVTYCASKWPVTAAEHEFARGLSKVMIYGMVVPSFQRQTINAN